MRIYLDGKLIAEDWTEHAPATVTGEVTLEAGKSYDIKMEYYESKIGAVARLVWQPPVVNTGSPYAEAVKVAKEADTVVLVLGLSSQLEGEEMNVREPGFLGGDRTDIKLPARQQAFAGSSRRNRQTDCARVAVGKCARSELGRYERQGNRAGVVSR